MENEIFKCRINYLGDLLILFLGFLILSGCNTNVKSKLLFEPGGEIQFTKDHLLSGWGIESNSIYVTWDSVRIYDYENKMLISNEHKARYEKKARLIILNIDGKWGAINDKYETIIPFNNDTLHSFDGGHNNIANQWSLAKRKDKLGIYNATGKVVLPFEYDFVNITFYNHFILKKDDKFGVLNYDSRIIIPFEYDSIWDYKSSSFYAMNDKKYGIIKIDNTPIIPINKDSLRWLGDLASDGRSQYTLFTFKENDKWGITDIFGSRIDSHLSDRRITRFIMNYTKGGSLRKVNSIRKDSIPISYFRIFSNGKQGVISSTGLTVFEPVYDSIKLDYKNKNLLFYKDEIVEKKTYKVNKYNLDLK